MGNEIPEKEIIYVGDPMCSWCWGFAPVLKRIEQDFSKDAPLRLIVGGLHAFDTDPMSEQYKTTIKHHWEQVAEATGQPFNYAFFDREGFVLDTEPACRASVVVRRMKPKVLLSFYERIHKGYYLEDTDTTKLQTFLDYAGKEGIDTQAFTKAFESEAVKQETIDDFGWCQQAGVTGFPTVVLREGKSMAALSVGYQPFDSLKPILDAWLSGDLSVTKQVQAAHQNDASHQVH
ncbi:MAG: DsbA family protein [Alphaproteobacteria bacterium]|nr:DsbA family protein [Alphaproteobacteria bacterium]